MLDEAGSLVGRLCDSLLGQRDRLVGSRREPKAGERDSKRVYSRGPVQASHAGGAQSSASNINEKLSMDIAVLRLLTAANWFSIEGVVENYYLLSAVFTCSSASDSC